MIRLENASVLSLILTPRQHRGAGHETVTTRLNKVTLFSHYLYPERDSLIYILCCD